MNTIYSRPPIKIALMGLGRSMFADHYPVFRDHPGLFQVVCACDLIKERRDIVAKDFPNCKMFRQYDDMLDERNIDLVDIATCSRDHVKHAISSLNRGFWTLLETPMSLTLDDAQILKGAAMKSKNRLIVMHRGLFDPDFLLARQMMGDPRLGLVYQLRMRREDYIRRDDWQCVKRLGGGAAYYAMPDMILQALRLLPSLPVQMWSDLKRIASLGDAEDYVHVTLKTRDQVSADIEFNGGLLAPSRGASFEIRGEYGAFSVQPGATEGTLVMVDPKHKFPRRRSSVRAPGLDDMHEDIPIVVETVKLPDDTRYGAAESWKRIYESVRTAAPFPVQLDEAISAVKFAQLMKRTSAFGK